MINEMKKIIQKEIVKEINKNNPYIKIIKAKTKNITFIKLDNQKDGQKLSY